MRKLTLLLFTCIFITTLVAQDTANSSPKDPEAAVFSSTQRVTIDGKSISLDTEAGQFKTYDEQNKPKALFGYTYYAKSTNDEDRPIMFAFNGGPGSSSFWLHMGILGPKRIVINDPGYTPAAPYELVNNEYSLLDVADLVMIDPIGTGLSAPAGESEFKDFWGVDQDIESISEFIRQFLIRKGRLNDPKFLLGESYGTFRNAGIMSHLQDMGIALNGVIMVSAVFDLRHLTFPVHEDLSYIVYIPTYAATAWYHDKVDHGDHTLESFIEEVRSFTDGAYQSALFKGDKLSTTEKNGIAEQLARYTGISADYWLRGDLRVQAGEYFQELLRDEAMTVGRLDSRFKGINPDPLAQFAYSDPQSDAISPPYITGFLDYLYGDLQVDPTLHYKTSARDLEGFSWDWKHRGNLSWGTQVAVNTGIDMADAMVKNPNLKVLILNGYYDLATVFHGVEYTIDHLGLPPSIKENIIVKYYEAGHMMYTHEPSMVQFREDVLEFINGLTER